MDIDIYDMRRAVVAHLIETRFKNSQVKFAEATKLSPSYVTRMLKPSTAKDFKRIGEEMALKLEAVHALGLPAGALLDPKPVEHNSVAAAEISNSEWDHLLNLRDMSEEDSAFLRAQAVERSSRFKAVRKQILESVGIHGDADSQHVTNALGNVPKGGQTPSETNHTVRVRQEQKNKPKIESDKKPKT